MTTFNEHVLRGLLATNQLDGVKEVISIESYVSEVDTSIHTVEVFELQITYADHEGERRFLPVGGEGMVLLWNWIASEWRGAATDADGGIA